MKKIISLFKRDYSGNRLVYNEIVPGAEWVMDGEGTPTEKYDGTCCLVYQGVLYKRYARKLMKKFARKRKSIDCFKLEHFKPKPHGWVPCEMNPDPKTGHYPGWLPVGDCPEDRWHREARIPLGYGTYELVGPKIQGNPYKLVNHRLWKHGLALKHWGLVLTFDGIRNYLASHPYEGIVWHHPDGRMVKIKRSDFGLPWPCDMFSEY